MNKTLGLLAGLSLMLSACGQPLQVADKTYPTYGFINEDSAKSEKMCYEVSFGNIFWGLFLVETLVAPVYFFGFSLFNPVSAKGADGKCGIDSQ